MPPRILSISYDPSLASTRQVLLESAGYVVTTAVGFADALERCRNDSYDLAIVGHSIPANDKNALIRMIRKRCNSPIVALRNAGEPSPPDGVTTIDADPGGMIAAIKELLNVSR